MNVLLDRFSQSLDPDVHAVVIWDQAGYHTANHLKVPDNITLIPLPPASPELNPIENLWHYVRSHHWSNHLYDDYQALTHAVHHAWLHTCDDSELIKTVCNAPYLQNAQQ